MTTSAADTLQSLARQMYPEVVDAIERNLVLDEAYRCQQGDAKKDKQLDNNNNNNTNNKQWGGKRKRKASTPPGALQWQLPTSNPKFDGNTAAYLALTDYVQMAGVGSTAFNNVYLLECCERILLAQCVSAIKVARLVSGGTYDELLTLCKATERGPRITDLLYAHQIERPLSPSREKYVTPSLSQILVNNRACKEAMFGRTPTAFYTNYPLDYDALIYDEYRANAIRMPSPPPPPPKGKAASKSSSSSGGGGGGGGGGGSCIRRRKQPTKARF